MKLLKTSYLLLLSVLLSGCEVIGAIFEAGFYAGIFLIVLILVIIAVIFLKIFRR